MRGAQHSAGYTVNTHKMVARYGLLFCGSYVDLFITRTDTDRHATDTTTDGDSTQPKAGKTIQNGHLEDRGFAFSLILIGTWFCVVFVLKCSDLMSIVFSALPGE